MTEAERHWMIQAVPAILAVLTRQRGAGTQIARACGVRHPSLTQWKAGWKRPSAEHAAQVWRLWIRHELGLEP